VIELEKQKLHLFSAEAGLMLFEGRVYIPPDPKIQQEILHDAHDRRTSRNLQDKQINRTTILVAYTIDRCKKVCQRM
jgi:hypothetical protein